MNVQTQTMAQQIDLGTHVTNIHHRIVKCVFKVSNSTTMTLIKIRCAAIAVVEFKE